MASLSSFKSKAILISLGMTPLRLILGILITSVMKDVEVAKLKAP